MKRLLIILSLILILISLTACWDYMEVEDMAIASTLAVDIDEESGLYLVNIEIVDVQASTSGINLKPITIESSGKTVAEAITNAISITTKEISWSHATSVIFSQDVARQDISPILDWITRHPDARLTIHPFVSGERTAKEIFLQEEQMVKIRLFQFEKIINSEKHLAKSPHMEIHDTINQITSKELHPVLPLLKLRDINGKTYADAEGAAYFSQGKLVGFLDPMETMKYLFIINELKGGVLVVPTGQGSNDKVTLTIQDSATKVKFEFQDDDINIIINIQPTVIISEIDNHINYTNKSGRGELTNLANLYLEEEIGGFIKDFQANPGIDIFHLGNKIKRRYPGSWKDIKDDWDSIFKESSITINSNIKIKSSEHISQPIQIKD